MLALLSLAFHRAVALLAEGVDRNSEPILCEIEVTQVALLAEGVDRNGCCIVHHLLAARVALLAEGVDRNPLRSGGCRGVRTSPSSRRAWIEIPQKEKPYRVTSPSPSSRRAWIEMVCSLSLAVRSGGRPPRGGRG